MAQELRDGLSESVTKAAGKWGEVLQKTLQSEVLPQFRDQVKETSEAILREVETIKKGLQPELVDTAPTHKKIINEAMVDIEAKRYKDAEDKLQKGNLDDFDVLKTLVSLYRNPNVQKLDDALAVLLSKEEKFKENAKFYGQLAVAYMDKDDRENAILAAHQYVKLSSENYPDGVKALILLGYTYYWFNDHASAIVYTEKALSLIGEQRQDLLTYICKTNLAFYYAQLKRDGRKALQYAEEAVAFDPNNAQYLDNRGYVRMQFAGGNIAELEKARADFILAGEKESLPAAYLHLSQIDIYLKELRK